MDDAQLNAITDVEILRHVLREKLDVIASREQIIADNQRVFADYLAVIASRDRAIICKDAKISSLTAEIARLRRVQFAARSEKMDPEQRALFEETMAADIAAVETELESLQAPTPAKPPRNIPARRPLPADLPRVEVRHEPESCTCGACGSALVQIGEHVSEKLDCKPLELFVRRDVHPQYACRACETVVAVPVAPAIIDRGIAAPGLLAQVLIGKYVDHLPLYRQEAIFARSGVEIGRNSLAEWIGSCGVALQPLVAMMRSQLLTKSVLHADETPVAQLDPGAGKTKRAYLFAYRTATGPPIVVFDYCSNRSGKHASQFLGTWCGALMVDDYSGYKHLFAKGITELGCWAHARRKFFDLHKANKSTLAAEALQRIAALYRIEEQARAFDADARHRHRQQHAAPLLIAFKAWLDAQREHALGASGTLNAIDYTLRRWPALTRIFEDGHYPIDNNPIENAIRPIALGRKNWLFAGSHTAGVRAAAIMSLLATAKANGHDPHAWLSDVLTRLPTTLDRDIEALLPQHWKPAC